jgi:hypothetical protein
MYGECTLNVKFGAFANNIPNGLKPFGAHSINSGGLYTRGEGRLQTGVKPVSIEKVPIVF